MCQHGTLEVQRSGSQGISHQDLGVDHIFFLFLRQPCPVQREFFLWSKYPIDGDDNHEQYMVQLMEVVLFYGGENTSFSNIKPPQIGATNTGSFMEATSFFNHSPCISTIRPYKSHREPQVACWAVQLPRHIWKSLLESLVLYSCLGQHTTCGRTQLY